MTSMQPRARSIAARANLPRTISVCIAAVLLIAAMTPLAPAQTQPATAGERMRRHFEAGNRQLLEMARCRHFQQAASARYLPQDREDNLVPGVGSVHDAARAGLHPRQRLNRRTRCAVERQGRRTQEAVPIGRLKPRLIGEPCPPLERSKKLMA